LPEFHGARLLFMRLSRIPFRSPNHTVLDFLYGDRIVSSPVKSLVITSYPHPRVLSLALVRFVLANPDTDVPRYRRRAVLATSQLSSGSLPGRYISSNLRFEQAPPDNKHRPTRCVIV